MRLSPGGHATVLGTSLGLVPIVVVWAVTLGGAMGYLGGRMGRRWPAAASAATRPDEPLQPTSGAGKPVLHDHECRSHVAVVRPVLDADGAFEGGSPDNALNPG